MKGSEAVVEDDKLALALNPDLVLSAWPDEDEGIGYLRNTGDIHLLSNQAKTVLEALLEKPLNAAQIYEEMDSSVAYDSGEILNNCIPHLINLGLIRKIPS